ncbi:uncharacterized protein LOC134207011 [Armigeres subalbatus]|uniref:uncharacterized protein LOC134207011 n=1 Tax=Armigeres subalbatus TaxID=124917 RepID=UPI002ED3539E
MLRGSAALDSSTSRRIVGRSRAASHQTFPERCVQFHDIAITMSIVDLQRFSKWRVLLRTVACVYRFASNCRRKKDGFKIEAVPTTEAVKKAVIKTVRSTTVPLKREEYQKAEAYLWRSAQADCFGDEIRTIKKNRQLPLQQQQQLEKSSSLYNLSPFLDTEDVLRMEGRAAQGSSLPFELRFPIILPKQHLVTDKLLEYYHHRVAHGNVESAVNEIRQRFSIQNLRAELKRIGKSCMWCKVKKCRARTPRMAPLPESRVTPGLPPFSHTGVDFCGPVTVTVGRRSEKRYICLFTCMTTRAVHLEVAHSLTTQACLMAIRRFVCRRGKPLEFYSDNGTNFQAASKAINPLELQPPQRTSHGWCLGAIGPLLKAALTVLNDGRTITDEVLLTTIAEAEDLINSRPLTYVGLEPGTEEALTPNHFVRGVGTIGEEHPVPPTSEAEALRDRYKRSQRLADKLWARWVFEYLPSINHRAKWHTDVPPIASGDLVYIADDAVRKSWIRGIVLDVYPGRTAEFDKRRYRRIRVESTQFESGILLSSEWNPAIPVRPRSRESAQFGESSDSSGIYRRDPDSSDPAQFEWNPAPIPVNLPPLANRHRLDIAITEPTTTTTNNTKQRALIATNY